jgi:hypothetical protein
VCHEATLNFGFLKECVEIILGLHVFNLLPQFINPAGADQYYGKYMGLGGLPESSGVGGLCQSGWHRACLGMAVNSFTHK